MAGISPEAGWKLLLSGDRSDFTIKCQEVVFKVHQVVIKADSDFCRVVCDSPFKVDIGPEAQREHLTDMKQESEEACVSLEEDDPEIIARVLEYLYTEDYTEEKPPELPGLPSLPQERLDKIEACQDAMTRLQMASRMPGNAKDKADAADYVATALETHAKLYGCADKLGLARLCKAASDRFKAVFPAAKHVFLDAQVSSILGLVYDMTRSSDTDLRYYMTTVCFLEGSVSMREAASTVIKQHEPLVFRVCESWQETLEMKLELEDAARAQRESLEGERLHQQRLKSGHEAELKRKDDAIQYHVDRIASLEARLWKSEHDLEDEMAYIDRALSRTRLAKYCAYCGVKDEMIMKRDIDWAERSEYRLSCLKCKNSHGIERPTKSENVERTR